MHRSFPSQSILLLLVALWSCWLSRDAVGQETAPQSTAAADSGGKRAKTEQPAGKKGAENEKGWRPMRGSWKPCEFGGDGKVEISEKLITIQSGDPLTGVVWKAAPKSVPRENYEIELEARRTDGFDFFCALTFPVGEEHVSFVLGGWGGGVVGISSIDGSDASDNSTTQFKNFDNEKWYRIRARVEPNEIRCWIDDTDFVEQVRQGHDFDIRFEMDPCVPIGLASFQCDAEYRNIRWRKLTKAEIAAAEKREPLKKPAR